MTSQTRQQRDRQILPNDSRSEDNQIMKFGKIFLQQSCRKWDKETSSKPLLVFLKSSI